MRGTWPLGFGILDVALPVIGVVLPVALVVGIVILLIAMKGKNDETDLSTIEEKSNF